MTHPHPNHPAEVCAGCGYDLAGLPPAAACPECGQTERMPGTGRSTPHWRVLVIAASLPALLILLHLVTPELWQFRFFDWWRLSPAVIVWFSPVAILHGAAIVLAATERSRGILPRFRAAPWPVFLAPVAVLADLVVMFFLWGWAISYPGGV